MTRHQPGPLILVVILATGTLLEGCRKREGDGGEVTPVPATTPTAGIELPSPSPTCPPCTPTPVVMVDMSTTALPSSCVSKMGGTGNGDALTWESRDHTSLLGIKIPDAPPGTPTAAYNPYPNAACKTTTPQCNSGSLSSTGIPDCTDIGYSLNLKPPLSPTKKVYGHIIIKP
jgi:hypothetical protein